MRTCVLFLVCMGFSYLVAAQGVDPPTITSRGEASTKALPMLLEFNLQAWYAEGGLESAMADALKLPEQFKALLDERGLSKADIAFRTPMIGNAGDGMVQVMGSLRVGAPQDSDSDKQATRFAELCSNIVSLGRELNVTIGGGQS